MATNLLSVAGLVGSPIVVGTRAGRIVDLVVRHQAVDTYPEITGFVVRVGRRLLFAGTRDVIGLTAGALPALRTVASDLPVFEARTDDIRLAADVLDRQIIDLDGAHVIRAADLYLAVIGGALRLIALDTSVRTLIRRLGPRRLRSNPAPQRVIDWSDVTSFTSAPDTLRLSSPLALKRTADLASIVRELGGTLVGQSA
jgi:magnesium transporter